MHVVVNMAELHCDLREEKRTYCKIRGLLGKCESEIKTDLDLIYGENVSPHRTITMYSPVGVIV
jgi:extradiol dioxygenase family protein